MIKACIFDLDGTLLNTVHSLRTSINEAVSVLGYSGLSPEETMRFVGNGTRKLVKRTLEIKNNDHDPGHLRTVLERYINIFKENCTLGNVPYDGIPEVLERLKSKGIKLAVLSNKPCEMTRMCIESAFGNSLFDTVMGEMPGIPLKPDPAGIINITGILGVLPDECLYIGDSDGDVIAGKAAGCRTAAVTWGYRSRDILEAAGPDHIIDSPDEILSALSEAS